MAIKKIFSITNDSLQPGERLRIKKGEIFVEPTVIRQGMSPFSRLFTRKEYSQRRILEIFKQKSREISADTLKDNARFFQNYKVLVVRADNQNRDNRSKSKFIRWLIAKLPIRLLPHENEINRFDRALAREAELNKEAKLKQEAFEKDLKAFDDQSLKLAPLLENLNDDSVDAFRDLNTIYKRLEENKADMDSFLLREKAFMDRFVSFKKTLSESLNGMEALVKAQVGKENQIEEEQNEVVKNCQGTLALILKLSGLPHIEDEMGRTHKLVNSLASLSAKAKEYLENLKLVGEIELGIEAVRGDFEKETLEETDVVTERWFASYEESVKHLKELLERVDILLLSLPEGNETTSKAILTLKEEIEAKAKSLTNHYFIHAKQFYEKENERRIGVEGTLLAAINTKDKAALPPLLNDLELSLNEDLFYHSVLSSKANPFLKDIEGYSAFILELEGQIAKLKGLKNQSARVLAPEAKVELPEMTLEEAIKIMEEANKHPILAKLEKESRHTDYSHWVALPKFIAAAKRQQELIDYVTSQMGKDATGEETGIFADPEGLKKEIINRVGLYFHTEDKFKHGKNQDPRPILREAPFAYARVYTLAKEKNLLENFFRNVFTSYCAEGHYITLNKWAETHTLPDDLDLILDLAECKSASDVLNPLFSVYQATAFRKYFERVNGRPYNRSDENDLNAFEKFKKDPPAGEILEVDFKGFIHEKITPKEAGEAVFKLQGSIVITEKNLLDAFDGWNAITCQF